MLYSLVAVFLSTNQSFIELRHLPLQHCAGQAAIYRQQTELVEAFIGEVRYLCVPEDRS